MAASMRPNLAPRKSNARPATMRPPPSRAQTATPTLTGRVSPPESSSSTTIPLKSPARSVNGGVKRKERDFDREADEETNINVVVRCRGRNDREVRENSGVVVSTEGVKGKKVDLSMGPSAMSNKTYSFDKVFSPAADQEMVYNEVVAPILDEVLGGFNCTIFAYGQTGTGKTYTMSGDITDTQPLPEAAGIIPRVLYGLFDKLGDDEGENSVKCSFIELYNEELRDLLSSEEHAKLKIYDDNSKKGQTTTIVQGMEESHIKTASKGLDLLRQGSHKRQVAATKCNDLSSRSHTVFTITVYMKRTSDTGEDFVSAGKLNLVDLAGSENIQRSGAENKRAAEAGLINKSLLTLGRVINALVEKSTHIPYRESKLTRLLQDSLGGRTKTCIVATLSPAKSNLEETISTLDYAFRAKNIKNKPQANSMVSKKTLLRDFTTEIEKLKSELVATRQRNGVYLTHEAYEEITTESESRRILSEEQRDKIEIMETSLRTKVQELFTLTNNFSILKKDNETTHITLDGTQGLLEKTELVVQHTKKTLAEETYVRQAFQENEKRLVGIGGDLLSTLEDTTADVRGLHAKLRRRSDLHGSNREAWLTRRHQVIDTIDGVDERLESLKCQQGGLLERLSERMQGFVADELKELRESQEFLAGKANAFQSSEAEVNLQTSRARDDMNSVLEEIKTLREDVKEKVGAGMQDLTAAAQRISAGISLELDTFHTQLHGSYSSLGKDFKSIFDDVNRQLSEQKSKAEALQQELLAANTRLEEVERSSRQTLAVAMQSERELAARERSNMLVQIASLVNSAADAQDKRIETHIQSFDTEAQDHWMTYAGSQQAYTEAMSTWSGGAQSLIASCLASRDGVKSKIKSDWSVANGATETLKATTQAVHGQTLDVVNAQMAAMDSQLSSLDEIIDRVKSQNESHHAAHTTSLAQLSKDVQESYNSIGQHMGTSYTRTQSLQTDISSRAADLSATFPSLGGDGETREMLALLKKDIAASALEEYNITGSTPAKTVYTYPTSLPRTSGREVLLERMRSGKDAISSPLGRSSPTKTNTGVYIDSAPEQQTATNGDAMDVDTPAELQPHPTHVLTRTPSLRDLDPNRSVAAQTEIPALPTPPITVSSSVDSTPAASEAPIAGEEKEGRVMTKLPTFSRSVTTSALPTKSAIGGSGRPAKRMTVATTAPNVERLEKENLPVLGGGGVEKVVEKGLLGTGGLESRGGRRSGRLRGRGSD